MRKDDEDESLRDAAIAADEVKWLEAARGGDADAFGYLVELHQRRVTRLAVRLLGTIDDADSAAQDAFIKAWGSIGDFRGDCPFGAWVSRIVVNVCRDRLRKKTFVISVTSLEREGDDENSSTSPLDRAADPGPDPERAALGREIGRRVAALMAELPNMQREVFALRYYEDRPLAEIAELFRVDVGTIKTHLFRATHRVRKSLEALYGERFPS